MQPVVRDLLSQISKLQTGQMTSLEKRMATLPPSLGFVNMCTREMIPRQLSYHVNDMSPISSPLFVLVEAKSTWGGDAEEGGCW